MVLDGILIVSIFIQLLLIVLSRFFMDSSFIYSIGMSLLANVRLLSLLVMVSLLIITSLVV